MSVFQVLPSNTHVALMTMMTTIVATMALIYTTPNILEMTNVKETPKKNNSKKKMTILSLFSSFDPKSNIMEMNWLSLYISLLVLMYAFFKKASRLMMTTSMLLKNIEVQFKIALKTEKDNSSNIFLSTFMVIMFCNLMGLMPNMFTSTSHITLNLFISVPLWTGFMLYGWISFTNKMFVHLVPNGTPTVLINFMVLIEMISNTIRPFTLSIRLMANMVSGHLLLTLMGNLMSNLNLTICLITIIIQLVLSSLETGVAFIQAYVFCMLLTLYSDESDYTTKIS